jgi:hypothetical protein
MQPGHGNRDCYEIDLIVTPSGTEQPCRGSKDIHHRGLGGQPVKQLIHLPAMDERFRNSFSQLPFPCRTIFSQARFHFPETTGCIQSKRHCMSFFHDVNKY